MHTYIHKHRYLPQLPPAIEWCDAEDGTHWFQHEFSSFLGRRYKLGRGNMHAVGFPDGAQCVLVLCDDAIHGDMSLADHIALATCVLVSDNHLNALYFLIHTT